MKKMMKNDKEEQAETATVSEHLLLTGSKLLEQHAILSLSSQLNSKQERTNYNNNNKNVFVKFSE